MENWMVWALTILAVVVVLISGANGAVILSWKLVLSGLLGGIGGAILGQIYLKFYPKEK